MAVIPDTKNEQIQFAEQHAPVWTTAATGIGLTTAQCTAITAATTAARTSYTAAQAARQSAKAATLQADTDLAALHTLLAEAVKTIRLFAESTSDPAVYVKAEIPAPAAPTPAKPPTQPVELKAVIGTMGELTIQWRPAASSAGFDSSTAGVIYTVRRKLAGQSAFSYIGTAKPGRAGSRGLTSFIDDALPANAQGIQYVVQGVRSVGRAGGGDLTGPASDILSVTLGVGGDGTVFVESSATEAGGGSVKLAA